MLKEGPLAARIGERLNSCGYLQLMYHVSYSKNKTPKPEEAVTGMRFVSLLYMNRSETDMCEHGLFRIEQLGKEASKGKECV